MKSASRPASQANTDPGKPKRISSSNKSAQKGDQREKNNIEPPIPKHLLERIAEEILDHSKQLGLFDDMRMRLLDSIESSKEFCKIKKEFNNELKELCQTLDLSLSRAKLRDKLNTKNLARSANKLREHVQQVSRDHKHDVRQLYNNHAVEFLASKNIKQNIKELARHEDKDDDDDKIEKRNNLAENQEQAQLNEDSEIDKGIQKAIEEPSAGSKQSIITSPDNQQTTINQSQTSSSSASSLSSTSSRADSFADSGIDSISPPSQGGRTPVNGISNCVQSNGSSTNTLHSHQLLLMASSALHSIIITDPEVLSEIPLPPTPTPPDESHATSTKTSSSFENHNPIEQTLPRKVEYDSAQAAESDLCSKLSIEPPLSSFGELVEPLETISLTTKTKTTTTTTMTTINEIKKYKRCEMASGDWDDATKNNHHKQRRSKTKRSDPERYQDEGRRRSRSPKPTAQNGTPLSGSSGGGGGGLTARCLIKSGKQTSGNLGTTARENRRISDSRLEIRLLEKRDRINKTHQPNCKSPTRSKEFFKLLK